MRSLLLIITTLPLFSAAGQPAGERRNANPPIHIAFLWHMHQPVYYPGESVVQTDANGRYPYSVKEIHTQRTGPYTSWPKEAVAKGAALPHFGTQVSFSGSLMANLNALEAAGVPNFSGWKAHWTAARAMKTTLNNPRLDMVAFGFHHPLMGLIEYDDIRRQIQAHRAAMQEAFGGGYSKGMFPPENAFSPRMVPALADEGIEWVLVDNIHFDRAAKNYPYSTAGNLVEPNRADQRNPDPADWVSLHGLWAPTKSSAAWGRRPHWVEYVDPDSGTRKRIIAVPADRYMGNEDGRGGFGALNYETVMSQLEGANTDPNRPLLIVLHHDGDNYGGGTDGYYGSNFQSFVNWVTANPSRFVCTTVQDYLDQYPVPEDDVIHIEDGSWSGADNGDPEFKKWNGDPYGGYSPDRNSWSIITAAKNVVRTAQQAAPDALATAAAWSSLLNAEASDYWYWDGAQNGLWDSHPARAANAAVSTALPLIAAAPDLTPPAVYLPQREPYNPGGTEWGTAQSSDMTVWTFVFDVKGVKEVTLKYRTDLDGVNDRASVQNETYAGGDEVSAWSSVPMSGTVTPSKTDPLPLRMAAEYSAAVKGVTNTLVDYYVEAEDSSGNVARSPIRHVWIGTNGGGGGGTGSGTVSWTPEHPAKDDTVRITVRHATTPAKLHWGVNHTGGLWQTPNAAYWPSGSQLHNGTGPALQTPFLGPSVDSLLTLSIGPFNAAAQSVASVAFVISYPDGVWDNNGGQDYHITFGGADTTTHPPFAMDGAVDPSAVLLSQNAGLSLYAGWNGAELYVAATSAPSAVGDLFVLVADSARPLRTAPWAKSGSAAGWNFLLGTESMNGWSGWFDRNGGGFPSGSKAGTALEGTLNLAAAFGAVPPSLRLAAAAYATADGGPLVAQSPAGNGDGAVDAVEFVLYHYGVSSARPVPSTPRVYALLPNHPNPFNPVTTVRYDVPERAEVRVTVVDVLGRETAVLAEGMHAPGGHAVRWNAEHRPSGVYFIVMEGAGRRFVRKALLLK